MTDKAEPHVTTPSVDYGQYSDTPMESASDRLKRKAIEEPFVPAGILGTIGVLSWGVYKFKHTKTVKPSLFLLQLRVMSQSMIVGAMIVGAVSHTINRRAERRALKESEAAAGTTVPATST